MKGKQLNWKAVQQFVQKNRYAALIILLGLFLLLWPFGGGTDSGDSAQSGKTDCIPGASGYEYNLTDLEEKLTKVLSQIRGAGETQVILTLSSTGSVVLAENQTSEDGSVETEVVIVKNGSNQEGVVEVEQQYPTFLGALVVCVGGGTAQVKLEMLQAVKALTGLSSDQISICERSGGDPK